MRKQPAVKSLGKQGDSEDDSMKLLGGQTRVRGLVKTAGRASISVSSFTKLLNMFSLTFHRPGFSLRDRIQFGARTLHFNRTSSLSRNLVKWRLRVPPKALSLCSKSKAA